MCLRLVTFCNSGEIQQERVESQLSECYHVCNMYHKKSRGPDFWAAALWASFGPFGPA